MTLIVALCSRFTALYAVFIGIGIGLGFVVQKQFGIDPKLLGSFVNLFSFFFALHIAKLWAFRRATPKIPDALRRRLQPKPHLRTIIVLVCAAIALTIDVIYHQAITAYVLGEPKPLDLWRFVLIAAVYAGLGHVLFDSLGPQSKPAKTVSDDGPKLVRQFQALGKGDKSVLISALGNPDSILMTVSGSDNDRMWSEFADLGWMERVPLPADFVSAAPNTKSVTWKITAHGEFALPRLVRRSMEG